MIDWQPIDTAPKDGTIVLLWVPNPVYAGGYFPYNRLHAVPACWRDECWLTCLSDAGGYDAGGIVSESVELVRDDQRPTHWAPINSPEAS